MSGPMKHIVGGWFVSDAGPFSGNPGGDPAFLKHQVAAIEGVIDIKIHATFLARLFGTE